MGFDGAGCVDAQLKIFGSSPQTDPGAWWVNVYRNGTLIATLQFSIGASRSFAITNQMTTAAVNVDNSGYLSCNPPVPQSAFSVNSKAIWVWFSYVGAQAGSVLSVNWIGPEGNLQDASVMLDYGGSGCAAAYFNGGADSGDWNVRVSLNSAAVFTLPFTIE